MGEKAPISQAGKNMKSLPILDHYLTFIHYFGFSINPTDVRSHYISIKVKPQSSNSCENKRWLARYKERAYLTFGSLPILWLTILKKSMKIFAIILTTFIALNHFFVLFHYIYDESRPLIDLLLEVRLVCTKFSALIFVLSWHKNQTKVRQLIKLIKSTSNYISGSQQQQNSCNAEQSAICVGSSKQSFSRRTCSMVESHDNNEDKNSNKCDNSNNNIGAEEKLNEVGDVLKPDNCLNERRILRWWIMCVSITVAHFSLSEVELTTDNKHLWEWLADYSFHAIDNTTISYSTLMFLASFDNYIYTVHVYGTRLIGASIICIVCSLQRENILNLKLNTMHLFQMGRCYCLNNAPYLTFNQGFEAPAPTKSLSSTQLVSRDICELNDLLIARRESRVLFPGIKFKTTTDFIRDKLKLNVAGGGIKRHERCFSSGNNSQLKSHATDDSLSERELFFILGESNWCEVERNTNNLKPIGYLSSSLWFAKQMIRHEINHLLEQHINRLAKRYYRSLRRWLLASLLHKAKVTKLNGNNATSRSIKQVTPTPTCHQLATLEQISASMRTKQCNNGNGAVAGFSLDDDYKTTPKGRTEQEQQQQQHANHQGGFHFNDFNVITCRQHSSADTIKWQLERLANKYELVRTVNARIDSCFGPMLFIQFTLLFLMSCIDLVYFSICFNPNTKTKHIIISGTILLWWPYILLYKFASDIASSSQELLSAIHRLARLSLLDCNHQTTISANCLNFCPQVDKTYHTPFHLKHDDGGGDDDENKRAGNIFHHNSFRKPLNGKKKLLFGGVKVENESRKSRASIISKLDHVFQPIHLSLLGTMTLDKFFLLNFAKIVITSSVMIIQFITN